MKVRANGIDIEVEDSAVGPADRQRPVVLLIMGLGMQLLAWPPELVQALVDAGFRVLRFDNRDVGLSQYFDSLGRPRLIWEGIKFRMGFKPRAPYGLSDMAADALGVLDALGIVRSHVVGASMGGMIAQRVALAAPQRVLSLTSIMSSSGARGLPRPHRKVLRSLLARPANHGAQAVVDHYVRLFTAIGSPGFPTSEHDLRMRIGHSVQRGYHPVGTLRQMMAILADTTRAEQLAQLRTPTLVLHGKADPLVPYAHGVDTARRIPGAQLVGIEGMGHDLPPGVVQRLVPAMLTHFNSVHAPTTPQSATEPKEPP